MFKKIVFYFSMLLLLFSCAGQIAKSQFERGEYRESVKTSLSLLENGKYSNLKLEEKQEILNRMKIIDNFYANAGVNLGFNKSSSNSKSHNEFGVVTTIKGKDENSSITNG